MPQPRTLYVSDLDGTLLNQAAELSAHARDRLNAMIAGGLDFTVATARTLTSAGTILSGLTLRLPVVLMCGALIYDTVREQFIQVNPLPAEAASAVIAVLKKRRVTGLMYQFRDGKMETYYETLALKPIRDFIENRVTLYNKKFRHTPSFSSLPPETIIYFTLLDTHDKVLPVYDALSALDGIALTMYRDNYSNDLWYLEVCAETATKEHAIHFLRKEYGYERVVGFGDNRPDLPMFKACDVSVAVENAVEEVRAVADHICPSNENDGVIQWLEEQV
jgi:Cof subfamily protein (haloacid dehalogenase superfamily)